VSAQFWGDPLWGYRRAVAVSNPAGVALTGYAVRVDLDGSFDFGRANADGSDLRVTAGDETTLVPFWIEKWDSAAMAASIWVQVPSLPVEGTTVYLYYGNSVATSTSDGGATFDSYDGFENHAVGSTPVSAAVNPGQWARSPANPVLAEGPPGSWDDHGATFASVIRDERVGEFRMYYHGFSFNGVHQIGMATSLDGENWTKYPGNPVMTPGPGAWDGQSVRVPMVWKEGANDYRMIYTGNGSGGMQVGYATSSDGITWTKHPGNPVFNDPTWANGETENWGVMKVGSEYLMWYSDFGMRQSGIAVSTDLVNWVPHQAGPIFASSGVPSDDRYSQFCPFSFRYGDYYYVLVPSYNSGGNYSRHYLYRSSSPYFPESDRHLVRVAHMSVPDGGTWDDHDNDTPFVLTLDIERSVFYNNQLWVYYASEGGSDLWKEGLLVELDIAAALSDAPLPGAALGWSATGSVTVVDSSSRQGARAVRLQDTSANSSVTLTGRFAPRVTGVVGAWMRRSSTSVGDYDIYLYGGSTLSAVAGLGRNGDFHYWNGSFQPTGVPWAPNTWYLVTLAFDAVANRYDFIVYDESLAEIVRVGGVASPNDFLSIDSAVLYTSSGFVEDGYADDFRLRQWAGADPAVVIGAEEGRPLEEELAINIVSPPAYQLATLNLPPANTAAHIDRAYWFTNAPAYYIGLPFIRTATSDRSNRSSSFLTFQVNKPVTVYVCYSASAASVPDWLSGNFVPTGEQISRLYHTWNVWKREYPAGTVTLGGNLAAPAAPLSGQVIAMYIVIIEEQ